MVFIVASTGSEESSSADQLPSNEEVEAMFQDVTKFVLVSNGVQYMEYLVLYVNKNLLGII